MTARSPFRHSFRRRRLPFRDADLFGYLLLRDQFLLGPLQGLQPVSLGLVHQ